MSSLPLIQRVRYEIKRRQVHVASIERLAPKMTRVVFEGEELADFVSLGFDDHVKLLLPSAEGASPPPAAPGADGLKPLMRDFTPRRFLSEARQLWVDFYLHDAGPATDWAAQASPGQPLSIGGPRGSAVITLEGIDSHVLIGDETALPAIGRRLEELPAGAPVLVVLHAEPGALDYPLETRATLERIHIARVREPGAAGQELIARLRSLEFPGGRCFIWVACESRAARDIRRYLTDERGLDKRWIKAAGYWQQGAPGTHETIQDEP